GGGGGGGGGFGGCTRGRDSHEPVVSLGTGAVRAGATACVCRGGGAARAGRGTGIAIAGDLRHDRDRVCGWGPDADHGSGRSHYGYGADEGALEGQTAATIPVPRRRAGVAGGRPP